MRFDGPDQEGSKSDRSNTHYLTLTFVLVDDTRLEAGQHVEGPAQSPHTAEGDVVHGFLGLLVGHLKHTDSKCQQHK